ncbi:MAG: hypothetical protein KGI54_15705 [Pseudomonadota bacterium]|nr:hypothetical protein [Pseudomonadota bacterium]
MSQNLTKYINERNNALINLDMEWAHSQMPRLSREPLLAGMHKARYEITEIPSELRHASKAWLIENGFKRLNGLEFPQNDLLPDLIFFIIKG